MPLAPRSLFRIALMWEETLPRYKRFFLSTGNPAYPEPLHEPADNRRHGCDSYGTDFQSVIWEHRQHEHETNEKPESVLRVTMRFLFGARSEIEGVQDMLGLIAAVLIILWLLGFFAFHVTTGFIHLVLIVGLILLVFHLLRGRNATA